MKKYVWLIQILGSTLRHCYTKVVRRRVFVCFVYRCYKLIPESTFVALHCSRSNSLRNTMRCSKSRWANSVNFTPTCAAASITYASENKQNHTSVVKITLPLLLPLCAGNPGYVTACNCTKSLLVLSIVFYRIYQKITRMSAI